VAKRDRRQILKHLTRCRHTASGETIAVDVRLAPSSGATLHVRLLSVPEHEHIRTALVDMTANRRIEEALRARDDQYRLLFDTNPCPMYVFAEASLRVLAANDAMVRLYGWSREELLGMKATDIRPEEDRPAFLRTLAGQRGSLAVHARRFRHWRKDGSRFDVEVTMSCLDYDGQAARLVLVNDITRRQTAERELKELNATLERRVIQRTSELTEANHRLQAVMGCALLGIVILDEQGRIEWLNPAALQILGTTIEEVQGECLERWMTLPIQTPGDGSMSGMRLTGKRPFRRAGHEVVGRRKDGTDVSLELAISGFTYAGRRQFVVMLRDITLRRQLEREVTGAFEQARREFGHDLHDGLGQHLQGLKYLASDLTRRLAQRSAPEAAEAARFAELLDEGVEQARSIARGLRPVENTPEGLMAGLRDLTRSLRKTCPQKVGFICRAPVLVADNLVATHLFRIAQEAVNNALRHAECQRVQITLSGTRDRVLLAVKDDGVGVRRRRGGIGMHVMQYRANAVRGSLVVHSAPGRGTEVVCSVSRTATSEGKKDNVEIMKHGGQS
jgi:PAS domain S-box-containing protein